MARRVVWSPPAVEDAEAIASYIGRDSARYAAAVVRKFMETARSLRDFPFSGRAVPELKDEQMKEKIVYSWRLIYRVEEAVVTIAALVHIRQNFSAGLERLGGNRAS